MYPEPYVQNFFTRQAETDSAMALIIGLCLAWVVSWVVVGYAPKEFSRWGRVALVVSWLALYLGAWIITVWS
jgi:hypothetical protein